MSLSAVLFEAGLGAYADKFKAIGVSLDQVLEHSPPELDALAVSANMLRGHAIKFKKCIADLKKTTPDKRAVPTEVSAPTTPGQKEATPLMKELAPVKSSQSGVVDQLKGEITRSLGILGFISEFKLGLDSFRDTILQFDVESYRRALDDIESLQSYYRVLGQGSAMDIES
jgi:hypothetical protein